jgi:integrase
MTLIQKRAKGIFYAVWWIPSIDGQKPKQKWKSTGTNKRTEAEKIAGLWAEAIRKGKVSEGFRARTAELQRELLGNDALITARDWVTTWTLRHKTRVSAMTFGNHLIRQKRFIKWLDGQKLADKDLSFIQHAHLQAFLESELERNATVTVNTDLAWLRALFADAVDEGLLVTNPAAKMKPFRVPESEEKTQKRIFTQDEIRTLLAAATPEWKSLIMFALYTGQRLGDYAQLRWGQVDLINAEIRLTTRKTKRRTIPAIGAPLMNWLLQQEMPDDAQAFVHPEAADAVRRNKGRTSILSRQFAQLLVNAGLRGSIRRKGGKVPGTKRVTHELSYHCFRHTCTTWLKQVGASGVIAQDFIGHDSAATSEIYTHIDTATKRRYADLLPDVTDSKPKTNKREP